MARLYEAAAAVTGARVGQSALARLLNTSPQRVKNWEARGISQQGANQAQAEFGINANWLLDGVGEMRVTASPNPSVRENISHYGSQPVTPDLEILHEALTLLLYDELHAGDYTPRARTRRLAELYAWVAADGGRLSDASNRKFDDQVTARQTGADSDGKGTVRRRLASSG